MDIFARIYMENGNKNSDYLKEPFFSFAFSQIKRDREKLRKQINTRKQRSGNSTRETRIGALIIILIIIISASICLLLLHALFAFYSVIRETECTIFGVSTYARSAFTLFVLCRFGVLCACLPQMHTL